MKKLLFIGIVALMVQSLGAVTLPSTSYSPYAGSTPSGESFTTSGGTMVTGSYSVLGAYEECTQGKSEDACVGCCLTNYMDQSCYFPCVAKGGNPDDCAAQCGGSEYKSCVNECHGGGSLPLDGGLSILLVLGVAGGAFKAFRARKNKLNN